MIKLNSYAVKTSQGPYLQINEDGYEFDLANNLFMVFDGFGGSGIGDACVEKLKTQIKTFYSRIYVDPDSTMPFYFSHKYLIEGNALINALHYTHKLLIKENSTKEMSKRAGASGSFVALAENIATIANVGNCQMFLKRNGKVKRLFIEDSFQMLSDDTFSFPLKTMPLSGFGLFEDFHFQIKELKIIEGDQITMMTDGVYSRLKEEEIHFLFSQDNEDPQKKIQKLFKMANDRGNMDNQTMAILEF